MMKAPLCPKLVLKIQILGFILVCKDTISVIVPPQKFFKCKYRTAPDFSEVVELWQPHGFVIRLNGVGKEMRKVIAEIYLTIRIWSQNTAEVNSTDVTTLYGFLPGRY